MSQPYLPNEVVNAVKTLQGFIDSQKSKALGAAQPRFGDNFAVSDKPATDRARYYKTNINALNEVLAGHAVETQNTWVSGLVS